MQRLWMPPNLRPAQGDEKHRCAARDFLQGDTYFHTVRPDQNLDRARAQFALLRSLESQDAAFRAAIPES